MTATDTTLERYFALVHNHVRCTTASGAIRGGSLWEPPDRLTEMGVNAVWDRLAGMADVLGRDARADVKAARDQKESTP